MRQTNRKAEKDLHDIRQVIAYCENLLKLGVVIHPTDRKTLVHSSLARARQIQKKIISKNN